MWWGKSAQRRTLDGEWERQAPTTDILNVVSVCCLYLPIHEHMPATHELLMVQENKQITLQQQA